MSPSNHHTLEAAVSSRTSLTTSPSHPIDPSSRQMLPICTPKLRSGKALHQIAYYIYRHEERFSCIPTDAFTKALADISMKNNAFQFGDMFWIQLVGTAMETPTAQIYSNMTFHIRKKKPLSAALTATSHYTSAISRDFAPQKNGRSR